MQVKAYIVSLSLKVSHVEEYGPVYGGDRQRGERETLGEMLHSFYSRREYDNECLLIH